MRQRHRPSACARAVRASAASFAWFCAALGASFCAGCERHQTTATAGADGVVAVVVDGTGFKPSTVKFKKGGPATLVFTRKSDDTCATEVVFPQLDLKKPLPRDQPVSVVIPTDKEQTLVFQCGMGMYKSSVVVAVN